MLLKCPTYTCLPHGSGRDGVLRSSDWSADRRAHQLAAVYRQPTDRAYAAVIAGEPMKADAATALCRALDFRSIASVGEIGGAPYIQAVSILSAFPHLRYIGTDFDGPSNEALAKVPMLAPVTIRTLDVIGGDLAVFDPCDWLVSFAVEYALPDDTIMRLLSYVHSERKSWALLTPNVIGVPQYVRLRAGYLKRLILRTPQRCHGWARSYDWFAAACARTSLTLRYRGRCGAYRLLWISS